jgi:hypothetical protein
LRAAILIAVLAAGCIGDIDEQWQLDHDGIIAVRATPPRITSGKTSTLDGFLRHKGSPTTVEEPEAAEVISPTSLAGALANVGGHWTVTAPSEDQIDAARTAMMLDAGAPVPLTIGVAYANGTLVATKIVWLGVDSDNPTLQDVVFDGAAAPPEGTALTVDSLVDWRVSVNAPDTDYDTNWLTSVGTMHDFDLPTAYLRVEKDDPLGPGEFGLVVRDSVGGVVWGIWPMTANPAPAGSGD